MEGYFSPGLSGAEGEVLEVSGRDVAVAEGGIADKAETAVIGGVSEDDAALRVDGSEEIEAGSNQGLAYAFALRSGRTETGPRPYQPLASPGIVTGEKAMWPTMAASSTATSERVRAPASLSASTMAASVWLLWGASLNAAEVRGPDWH